ncbi:unnamed protein product [Mesocestoides corti]|nr:unnamed protein product [Mesocestoides corti]
MKCVRSSPWGADDGPFEVEEDKVINVSDIRKIVLFNVNPVEVHKDEAPPDVSCSLDDPDTCLQHYFNSNEDAEAFSLTSDDNFPPEAMFAVNEQKYNVTSSYRDNLEGYTVPLDKSDPNYKTKEVYYTKIAEEIQDVKDQGSAWDSIADDEAENEELRYSAVLQDGVQGRELKGFRSGRRGGRGSKRASLPRDYPDAHRPGDGRSLKAAASVPFRDLPKTHVESSSSKSQTSDGGVDKPPSPKSSSHDITPAALENSTNVSTSPDADSSVPVDGPGKKAEKKKFTLDPDAPEFKPSGIVLPIEPSSTPQTLPAGSLAFTPAPYSQPVPCSPLQMPGFTVAGQHSLPNGSASTAPFSLPSSMSCMIPPIMAPQLAALRQPPQTGFSPQQLAMMSQQLSASGTFSAQQSAVQSAAGSKTLRQAVPTGTYTRQRSVDQTNSGAQQMPFSLFPPQGFSFVQTASYPISVPFIPAVSGSLQSTAYPGMHALTGAVPSSQASGQQTAGVPTQPQSGQVNHAQPSSQPITSAPQSQGPQFHAGYNHQIGAIQGQPATVAAYPQYTAGQLIGSQAPPGALSFYPQSIYQAPGLIQFPVHQVGANSQPPQINSQLHHQNQQPLIPPQPLQLQPGQQQGPVQSVQQQPQPQILLAANPYITAQQLFAQAMTMGVPPQGVQNAFTLPQNVHTPAHSVQLYMPQQPSGAG